MKKPLLLLFNVLLVLLAHSQVPLAINYQGVARNASGNALPNQDIKLRLSIRNQNASGSMLYQETRSLKTNNFGMFNLAIGSPGSVNTLGSVNTINWGDGDPKFLQVEIDNSGGNAFVNMGAAQLLSVPYAIYAANATPSGVAGGSLKGTYPNPSLADGSVTTIVIADNAITSGKIADEAVNTNKIASNAITSDKIIDDAITTGKIADDAVSSIKIKDNAITTSKLDDDAVTTTKINDGAITTTKIEDGSITAAKLAPGVITSGGSLSGNAGGDLNGQYPNPSIASQAVTTSKIANGAVVTPKLADGAVTTNKIADGSVTAVKLAAGVIPPAFSLPYSSTVNSSSNLFSVTQQGGGIAISGTHSAGGTGVSGSSLNGDGVKGRSSGSNGVSGSSLNGVGVYGTSDNGLPGLFSVSSASNFNDAVFASNNGYGNGLLAISTYSNGVLGIANDVAGAGVFGINNSGGEAIVGRAFSDIGAAVVGRNDGTYAGVRGTNAATGGIGVVAQANVDGASNGTALLAELEGTNPGDVAVFKVNGTNVARIDNTGKAFFNNGAVSGGADVAEYFDVEGNRGAYEPGDVLVISQNSDRKVEKSSAPYSFLVSGVYATKAGLMLTEENAEAGDLQRMVPMGVIGVIPTKVCLEGGNIKRGDLLVTSSIPGVAMKGDIDKIKVGQVLGKALQDYNGAGTGKINVLVSVK